MCGILLTCQRGSSSNDGSLESLIRRRGPDRFDSASINISGDTTLHLSSSVLALRGNSPVSQPLRHADGSLLAWNGEAWQLAEQMIPSSQNDAETVLSALSAVAADPDPRAICQVLGSIRGPFAFVFYAASIRRLYYGRDPLGRRSLVAIHNESELSIASVGHDKAWSEVPADGVRWLDVSDAEGLFTSTARTVMWDDVRKPFPSLNRDMPWLHGPVAQTGPLHAQSLVVSSLATALHRAMETRLVGLSATPLAPSATSTAPLAILFSGGLDCSVLARIAHGILPLSIPIDLLNVAFENPRVIAAANSAAKKSLQKQPAGSPYELCPDRLTGRATHAELVRVCPERRWNFVAINVPYESTCTHREQIMMLMHPHNTEMDLSISLALYFAARAEGVIDEDGEPKSYNSPVKVLLSGLGADELFGGYSRHGAAFERAGDLGLAQELELDFKRIGQRNLGRDDRVVAHWGREVRYPYLDEDVVSWALQTPVRHKCDFAFKGSFGRDPAKGVLREVARQLGMEGVAEEKKRAIQFGSRTAKMTQGRVKGTERLCA